MSSTTLENDYPSLRKYAGRYLLNPPDVPAPGTRYAAAYARLSKDKYGDELGVDRQLEDVVSMLLNDGYVPVIYVDNSVSATSGIRRPRYQDMVAHITAGRLHTVGCYDTTRLFRDNLEQEIFMRLAQEIALEPLRFKSGGEKDLCDYTGQFEFRINGAVAARHVAELKAKLKRSHKQRFESGRAYWPKRPFGFERMKRDGTGVIHREDEAALIRQAYKDVLRGRSIAGITREWNEKGYRTPTCVNEDGVVTSGGNEWKATVVRNLLLAGRNAGIRERTERRNGKRVKTGDVCKADWEPIVDRDLYDGVVALLRSRKAHPSAWVLKHLLTSIAYCGKCGKTIASSKRDNGVNIYRCLHHGCYGVRRNMHDVDTYIVNAIGLRLSADDAKDLCKRDALDTALVASVEEKIDALVNVRKLQNKLAIQGEISADECEENIAEINAKIATLHATITEPARAEVFEDAVNADDPRVWFDNATLDRKRAIIDELCSITILPGQNPRRPFDDELVVIEWKQ
ncbi:recombinase family protein [Mycobacterium sp. OTB74]|uniref:recombinase family protein n=1 Tax=Mycobacterium sp. OTB74 TaxID=1853452 RepID=UPI002472ED08|nr:recombinase family protein [Mycobacterium sp. OTB74]MDH6247537.1 site-specific DNA recombinase [Mycobacterium sp. OTB74]